MSKLAGEIRAHGITNPHAVQVATQVATEIHQEIASVIVRRNEAINTMFDQFIGSDMDYVKVVRQLRSGRDPASIQRFDEITEFVAREFPDVLQSSDRESSTNTAEEAVCDLLTAGVAPVPKPWDTVVLEQTLSLLGSNFEAYFEDPRDQFNFGDSATTRCWATEVEEVLSF